MKSGISPKAGHIREGWDLPVVVWGQLEGGEVRVLGRGHYAVVYRATLTLQDGQRVAVALKNLIDKPFTPQSIPLEEARVLQALEGVEGVPALHGVTDSPPHILVMSLCPGLALSAWRRRGEIRVCLKAVKELCVILTKMHHRGITHGDLHGCNVLVNVSNGDGETSVWVIDFGHAKRNADTEAMKKDVKQVMVLVRNILMAVEEETDGDIYHSREMIHVLTPDTTLEGISSLVCGVLRDPADETVYRRSR